MSSLADRDLDASYHLAQVILGQRAEAEDAGVMLVSVARKPFDIAPSVRQARALVYSPRCHACGTGPPPCFDSSRVCAKNTQTIHATIAVEKPAPSTAIDAGPCLRRRLGTSPRVKKSAVLRTA